MLKKYSNAEFSILSCKVQDSWLSNRLKYLQRALDHDGYKVFLMRFDEAYNQAKSRQVHQYNLQHMDEVMYKHLARNVLFQCVQNAEANLNDLIQERDAIRQYNALTLYSQTIKTLTSAHVPTAKLALMGSERSRLLDDTIAAIVTVEKQSSAAVSTAAEQLAMESQPRFKKALKFLKHGSTADTLMLRVAGQDWMLPSPSNRDAYRKTLQTAVKAKALPLIALDDIEAALGS